MREDLDARVRRASPRSKPALARRAAELEAARRQAE
jgi:hypothetical protein